MANEFITRDTSEIADATGLADYPRQFQMCKICSINKTQKNSLLMGFLFFSDDARACRKFEFKNKAKYSVCGGIQQCAKKSLTTNVFAETVMIRMALRISESSEGRLMSRFVYFPRIKFRKHPSSLINWLMVYTHYYGRIADYRCSSMLLCSCARLWLHMVFILNGMPCAPYGVFAVPTLSRCASYRIMCLQIVELKPLQPS